MLQTGARVSLNKFQVSSVMKPNAGFSGGTESVVALSNNFSNEEFVIILAGTNDIKSKDAPVQLNMDAIKPVAQHSNVIISSTLI